jgi:WD40 repeat protein
MKNEMDSREPSPDMGSAGGQSELARAGKRGRKLWAALILVALVGIAVAVFGLRSYESRVQAEGMTVYMLAFSSDGRWLASVGFDDNEVVRLWDLQATDSENELLELHENAGRIFAVMISPNGRWLITGNDDTTARVWDLRAKDPTVSSGVLCVPVSNLGFRNILAMSPDGRWLVSGGDEIWLRDLQSTDPTVKPVVLKTTDRAISSNGRWLAARNGNDSLQLWDLLAKEPGINPRIIHGYGNENAFLGISPDGRWLAIERTNQPVLLWDLHTQDPSANPSVLRGVDGNLISVVFSPDGHWLVSNDENLVGVSEEGGTIQLWNLQAADPGAAPVVEDRYGYQERMFAAAYSPDGRWLAVSGNNNTALLWDLQSKDPKANEQVLRGHGDSIWSLEFSPDGHSLASGSQDGTVRLWKLWPTDLAEQAGQAARRILTPAAEWKQFLPVAPYRISCPPLVIGK